MAERRKHVAAAGQREDHCHHNQTGSLERQAQPLDHSHEQVEAAPGPVVVKVADEVGEGLRQGADTQQEGDLNKDNHQALHNADDQEDDHQRGVEDIGHPQSKTHKDVENAEPLAVEGEVLLLEVGQKAAEHVQQDGRRADGHGGVWMLGCVVGIKDDTMLITCRVAKLGLPRMAR